ncbi:MAG: 4Fe-4S dicluster domain-containing protein [Deltaproteobacteria bacterium]|nr:4Fe-4S dicluster domain-containing protein [Deltaproteobacteria bacterium]
MGLLLMHALDSFITSSLFVDYYPTLNPFLFLRNLFAFLVIAGLILAAYRRFFLKTPRLMTGPMDFYAMILLAVIMVSGILLEGAKIASHTRYQDMVMEYADLDEQELVALESYWVNDFGVVSPDVKEPFDKQSLALGNELHQMNCAECHSAPQWAFLSYGAAKTIQPLAVKLDRIGLSTFLWTIHFLAGFIGLAYLPFSKMFHIFTGPLSLLANAVMDKETSDPANIATKQIMELDACVHCGACTLQCAVGVSFEEIHNVYILPSEKIAAVKALAAGKKLSETEVKTIQNGLVLCTNCYRCTDACPVGINLQDLWFDVREALLQKECPEYFLLSPLSLYRGNKSEEMVQANYQHPLQQVRQAIADACTLADARDTVIDHTHLNNGFKRLLAMSVQGHTSSSCFACKTCTLACPVVRNFDKPRESLGMMPHQIVHSANLGLADLAFSSRMLWSCLGCYACQEHCPQGVEVADVLYEIKMLAINRFNRKTP